MIAKFNFNYKKIGVKVVSTFLIFNLFFFLLGPYFSVRKAQAATLSEAGVLLYRMGASVAASSTNAILVVVKIPTAAAATEDEIRLTIPDTTSSGFTVDSTPSNITTTTSGLPSTFQGETLTVMPSLAAAANAVSDGGASTTVDIVIGNLTSNSALYGFLITGGITNPSGGGSFTWTAATLASNSVVDSQDVSVDTLSSSTGDQVTVTATVPPTFNFALGSNSIALGTLSSSSVSNEPLTSGIDVDTNANNGYTTWIRSEGGAATLASASTSDAISSTNTGSPVTCSAGTECYVVDVGYTAGSNGSGSVTVATEYDGGGDTNADTSSTIGGVISTSYEEIIYRSGVIDSEVLEIAVAVAITSVNKPASDYTDTLQIVGAGNF